VIDLSKFLESRKGFEIVQVPRASVFSLNGAPSNAVSHGDMAKYVEERLSPYPFMPEDSCHWTAPGRFGSEDVFVAIVKIRDVGLDGRSVVALYRNSYDKTLGASVRFGIIHKDALLFIGEAIRVSAKRGRSGQVALKEVDLESGIPRIGKLWDTRIKHSEVAEILLDAADADVISLSSLIVVRNEMASLGCMPTLMDLAMAIASSWRGSSPWAVWQRSSGLCKMMDSFLESASTAKDSAGHDAYA